MGSEWQPQTDAGSYREGERRKRSVTKFMAFDHSSFLYLKFICIRIYCEPLSLFISSPLGRLVILPYPQPWTLLYSFHRTCVPLPCSLCEGAGICLLWRISLISGKLLCHFWPATVIVPILLSLRNDKNEASCMQPLVYCEICSLVIFALDFSFQYPF